MVKKCVISEISRTFREVGIPPVLEVETETTGVTFLKFMFQLSLC